MGFLNVVLLMLMSSSCSIAAEASGAAPWAPGHINAHGRVDAAAEHASSHRRHNKNDSPGVRFDMTRRSPSCAGSAMLQCAESRSRHFACAIERNAHRPGLLAGKRTGVSTEADSGWTFPEFSGVTDLLVSIYLGTPPVKANVIIDTGSDLTWIQAKPCKECYTQADSIFDPSKSSTYKKIACFSPLCNELLQNKRCSSGSCRYAYRDSPYLINTEGYFSTDTLTVDLATGGKAAVALFQFGASDKTFGLLSQLEDGVLGLGRGPISLPSQLGKLFGKKFSICPVDWLSNETSSLYFGDAAVPKGEVQYTPMVHSAIKPSLYYIRVLGISVGPTRLPINQSVFEIDSSGRGGTVINIGSVFTWFMPEVFDQIATAYKSQVRYPVTTESTTPLDLCFDTTGVKSPKFPTLGIHLDGGGYLSLPTPNTFITLEENVICLAAVNFTATNVVNFTATNVLGNMAAQNFDVVYDLENMQIGFSPADCASV